MPRVARAGQHGHDPGDDGVDVGSAGQQAERQRVALRRADGRGERRAEEHGHGLRTVGR